MNTRREFLATLPVIAFGGAISYAGVDFPAVKKLAVSKDKVIRYRGIEIIFTAQVNPDIQSARWELGGRKHGLECEGVGGFGFLTALAKRSIDSFRDDECMIFDRGNLTIRSVIS